MRHPTCSTVTTGDGSDGSGRDGFSITQLQDERDTADVTSVGPCHSSRRLPVLIVMTSAPPSAIEPTPQITAPAWMPEAVWPFPVSTLGVAGRRVAYTDVGTGPCLLFSNAGQWSFLWRDIIGELRGSFRCVTFDPLGFGLSDRIPAEQQTLDTVADTIGALVDHLDLYDVVIVMHDLSGVSALAAMSTRQDRLCGLVAANTFAWRPTGPLLRTMLAVMGSTLVRELDAMTGVLPRATSRRFGVGRHLDRESKRAFRLGLRDRDTRRGMHRLFRDARTNTAIYQRADTTIRVLGERPALTVFGALGDYLGFQKKWRRLVPTVTQRTIPWGLHFPMADNPALAARHIRQWHNDTIGSQLPVEPGPLTAVRPAGRELLGDKPAR